jgi:hypothetical protein
MVVGHRECFVSLARERAIGCRGFERKEKLMIVMVMRLVRARSACCLEYKSRKLCFKFHMTTFRGWLKVA